jgi:uncharacterized protein YjeT (DUF2065 family)
MAYQRCDWYEALDRKHSEENDMRLRVQGLVLVFFGVAIYTVVFSLHGQWGVP